MFADSISRGSTTRSVVSIRPLVSTLTSIVCIGRGTGIESQGHRSGSRIRLGLARTDGNAAGLTSIVDRGQFLPPPRSVSAVLAMVLSVHLSVTSRCPIETA